MFAFLIIFYTVSCHTANKINHNSNPVAIIHSDDSLIMKERANLKKYALCKCLLNNYPDDSVLIYDGSMEGFFEMGAYGNHAYELVDSLIKKRCRIKYISKHQKKLFIMRCIDIYDSKELDSLVKSLDGLSGIMTDAVKRQ